MIYPYTKSEFVVIQDTNLELPYERKFIGYPEPDRILKFTIVLAWKTSLDDLLKKERKLDSIEFDDCFLISSQDYLYFRNFIIQFQLSIIDSPTSGKYVQVSGKIKDIEAAFKITIKRFGTNSGHTFLTYVGCISIPRDLEGIIEGVLGLDSRPYGYVSSHLNDPCRLVNNLEGYYVRQVADLYRFPADVSGKHQNIAIIQFGGGYDESDLQHYFRTCGLQYPDVNPVGSGGAVNSPTHEYSFDKEVTMNISVASSVANDANIFVYFSPNSEEGFLLTMAAAIHGGNNISVISISWGAPEENWSVQALKLLNDAFKAAAILGITICAATGNFGVVNGPDDGALRVDFPASSPYVLACGGTTLKIVKKKLLSETAWMETPSLGGGGGVSRFFERPKYQLDINVPASRNIDGIKGRGVPDISGNASSETGYNIYVHGKWHVIGGTSAVAPLYAGLIALLNEKRGMSLGFIHPKLYSGSAILREVLRPGRAAGNRPYQLNKDWNPYTGLGVFSGLKN